MDRETRDEFHRVHNKLDNIDMKLDEHLDRLSKAENSVEWLKAHLKGVTTIGLTVVLSVLGYLAKIFIGEP